MQSRKKQGGERKKEGDRRRGQTQLWVANGMPYFAALSVLLSLWAINANEMAKQVEERREKEVKMSSTIKIQNIIAYFCAPSKLSLAASGKQCQKCNKINKLGRRKWKRGESIKNLCVAFWYMCFFYQNTTYASLLHLQLSHVFQVVKNSSWLLLLSLSLKAH